MARRYQRSSSKRAGVVRYLTTPEQRRYMKDWRYRKKYGISLEDFERMFVAQNFHCAACGSPDPASKHGWHLDHDHRTKRVRGILCSPCNTALGAAHDNPDRLRALADYIERTTK